MRRAAILSALGALAAGVAFAGPATDPATRLHNAHSLRCHFTAEADTKWTNGKRSITNENLNPQLEANKVLYDSIDTHAGTARAVGNIGASTVRVSVDSFGALWIVDRAPAGFIFVTTILPMYAAGTDEFVVLESRHSWVGAGALAEQSSGSCTVLD